MIYDVAVIGAGPAGAAISSMLVQNSFSTAILEKSTFPRFSIGESLLPQSMVFLDNSGLLNAIPQEAFQIKKGALFKRNNQEALIDFSQKFSPGPTKTWQVFREEFDTLLITDVKNRGADTFFNTEVASVNLDSDIISLTCESRTIKCKFVIDASGNAMVLPRLMGTIAKPKIEKKSLFRHFYNDDRSPDEEDNILITVHPENDKIWYWAIPLSNGRVSVGVAADNHLFDSSKSDDEVFSEFISQEPNLSQRLSKAAPVTDVRSINAYKSNVERSHGDNFLIIGNAAGFIDPIFSSGLTIALKSAVQGFPCVKSILHGEEPDWANYDREMAIGNKTFKAYVESWYDGSLQDIIFTPDKEPLIQEKINSILAGYAWDMENSFVREPQRKLKQLHKLNGQAL